MHFAGLQGMHRKVLNYPHCYSTFHIISSLGSVITFVGIIGLDMVKIIFGLESSEELCHDVFGYSLYKLSYFFRSACLIFSFCCFDFFLVIGFFVYDCVFWVVFILFLFLILVSFRLNGSEFIQGEEFVNYGWLED
uniref:Uncharacterized protein n=1 Tax=Onchocerca volvulus TaxID=6282 RepID=A0A8R1Y3U0_ONCVO